MLNYKNTKNKIANKVSKNKIAVFYHLYIPDTNNMWIWWVDEQMSLLRDVGLSESADVNMCITLPLGLHNSKTGHTYDSMVTDYILERYPFVNIISKISTDSNPNIFEGQTLEKIYEHTQNNDGYVFYFHNKGMSSYTTHIPGAIKDWRHYMQYFNIEKWKECVEKLEEGYECVGVDWVERHDIKLDFVVQHYAGNFWWARNDYIRNLKHPLKIEQYMDVNAMMRELKNYRYCFELWMATGNPKQYCFHYRRHHQYDNQGLERYFIYYPREMYDESLNSDLDNKMSDRINTLVELASKSKYSWRDHRNFADWVVRLKRPEVIVDIGVQCGYSSFCFATPNIGKVYSIDTFDKNNLDNVDNRYEYFTNTKEKLEIENIEIVKSPPNKTQDWNKKIDIIHINGLLEYSELSDIYYQWMPHLKDDGIIILYGTMLDQFGSKKLYEEISLPKTNFKHCNGMGVISKDEYYISLVNKNFEEFIK